MHAGQEKAAFENKQKSSIFAWGQGAFGKLGLGSDLNQFDPKLVSALEGLEIKELKTGKTISACIDQDGNILTWGKPINVRPGSRGTAGLRSRRPGVQPVHPDARGEVHRPQVQADGNRQQPRPGRDGGRRSVASRHAATPGAAPTTTSSATATWTRSSATSKTAPR